MRMHFRALLFWTAATLSLASTGIAGVISETPLHQERQRHSEARSAEAKSRPYRPGAPSGPTQVAHAHSRHNMIELLLEACRAASCRRFSLLYDPFEMSLMNCMFTAQQEAARWATMNPGWRVSRMSCRHSGLGDQET